MIDHTRKKLSLSCNEIDMQYMWAFLFFQFQMLVYVKQSTEDKVIGIVRRVHSRSPCCPSHFSLERPNGAVLLKIRSSSPVSNLCCCCTCLSTCPFFKRLGRAFHILMSDEVTNIGNIGYFHQNFGSEDPEDGLRGAMITASFPGDATASSKALILASLFMLVGDIDI
jgi:hypothetical protein